MVPFIEHSRVSLCVINPQLFPTAKVSERQINNVKTPCALFYDGSRLSVCDHMNGNDGQDAPGDQSRRGNQQSRAVPTDNAPDLEGCPPKLGIMTPAAQYTNAADRKRRERKRDEENVKTKERTSAEPIDEATRALCRFIRFGLNVSQEEGGHEQGRGENQEQFESGKYAFMVHGYFVSQSEPPVHFLF